ncbi:MAG: cytochrome oxidase subunit III [Flavobacteriales bacterium]|nr:cytochrome oxidase subunit III [Flavobacteriales bacterium]|tara:strand:- start:95 stop:706 length:612 start_codon:yes stop_codon:yes gene_type:complete
MSTSTENVEIESLPEEDFQKAKRKKVAKPLLWFGMISIVMLFAGLTSAVIVRKGDGNWTSFELPDIFLFSTIALALSSVTLWIAKWGAKRDQQGFVKAGLSTTFALGLAFIYMQLEGYEQLVEMGIFFTGAEQTASGSFLYIISALHIAHLVGGIIALIVTMINGFLGHYKSKNLLGLQLCSIYWHFMDAMWIYLYIFFTIVI